MLFLGHLGQIELAGGSLAIGFANITGYSVIKGISIAMEPICSQAYGAKKFLVLSQTYKNTLIFLLVSCIPITLLWLYVEPIFLFLGQDESITKVAKLYILYSIPELLAQSQLHPLRIFLRTQNCIHPVWISSVFAMIFHLPISYFLVVYMNLGVKGVALSSCMNTTNSIMGLVVYLLLKPQAIKPWNSEAIETTSKGWRQLLMLIIPSVLSVCLEWWFYEIMTLLCGLLSNPKRSVATMGILIQFTSLLYVIPYSLSLSLSTYVGQELGARKPEKVKRVSIVGVSMALLCGVFSLIFSIWVKNFWGKLYTLDEEIVELVAVILPIVGLCEVMNCPQTAICGVLIGSARAKIGAFIKFGAFYGVGLPFAVIMGFNLRMGLSGLWYGLAAAQCSCMCMMVFVLVVTDWNQQVERAKEFTEIEHNNDLEASFLK
ncbi:MATE efflux family protein [Euphorbia peplus]|nr:MATE efflux family protein [Euphorbia peplus]